ncbi:MAG TPA: energy transducer TonB [Pyrinomonadaceae bacterium]|jgi:TonB family protein
MTRRLFITVSLFGALCLGAQAQEQRRRVTVAVLEMGSTPTAARVAERLAKALAPGDAATKFALLDRGMSAAAARGVGYAGSLNLSLDEARTLGAALGCDFFLAGDAQTIRRSSSARPVYFESYATVFVVSARTGRLAFWTRPAATADTAEEAEAALLASLGPHASSCALAVAKAAAGEDHDRFEPAVGDAPGSVIDLSAEGEAARDLREPAPYRRLRPAYTDEAARAEAEATVDVEVEIGADGRVGRARVVRWAGFGLDEEVVSTVRRMHFRPAEREGEPVAVRVLLRYNFRKPSKT